MIGDSWFWQLNQVCIHEDLMFTKYLLFETNLYRVCKRVAVSLKEAEEFCFEMNSIHNTANKDKAARTCIVQGP